MPILTDPEFQQGRNETQFVSSIARTDTSAKNLFTLPAGAIVKGVTISSPAASNAGTTATLSLGISGGSATAFLNALDVKTVATGAGTQTPTNSANATNIGTPLASPTVVTGIYAETGGASSAGGPWLVTFDVYVV